MHSPAVSFGSIMPGAMARAAPLDFARSVVFRHLRTRGEIEQVLHLREGIDLSVHASDPEFLALEKKETK